MRQSRRLVRGLAASAVVAVFTMSVSTLMAQQAPDPAEMLADAGPVWVETLEP